MQQSCDAANMFNKFHLSWYGLNVALGYTARHLVLFSNPNQKGSTSHLSGKCTDHAEV